MAKSPKTAPVEDFNFYLNARNTSMVRVAWTEYQGRKGLDIREHYLNDDDEWQPTGKGLRIKESLVPEFVEWLKGELDANVSEPEEEPEEEQEPEEAPRRGRGRPAREPEEEAPRRGRGRPRVVIGEEEPEDNTPPRRRRG